LPFEDTNEVADLLAQLKSVSFRMYANVKQPTTKKNVTILPLSRRGFIDDLAASSGAICNTGFSFISEALYLGKKILTKPVKGQIEQLANALALESLQLGTIIRRVDVASVETWINAPEPAPLPFVDLIPLVARWIDSESYRDCRDLMKMAWKDYPDLPAEGKRKSVS
jgi:uncharacterized protein (TIGR00661 family)